MCKKKLYLTFMMPLLSHILTVRYWHEEVLTKLTKIIERTINKAIRLMRFKKSKTNLQLLWSPQP